MCCRKENDSLFTIVVSSYYNNQSLFNFTLKPKESVEASVMGSQAGGYMRKKLLEYDFALTLADSLTTLSPITDILPLAGGNEVDLICLSGSHHRSSLTFVKEYLPFDHLKLQEMPGVKRIFTIRDKNPGNTDSFVVISN